MKKNKKDLRINKINVSGILKISIRNGGSSKSKELKKFKVLRRVISLGQKRLNKCEMRIVFENWFGVTDLEKKSGIYVD